MKQATYQITVSVYDKEPKYFITCGNEKLAAAGNSKALGWAIEQLISLATERARDAA